MLRVLLTNVADEPSRPDTGVSYAAETAELEARNG
jgi:hypothetical protein